MEPAKVLVVDDEQAILMLLKEALTKWGYQVTTASTGAEALEVIRGGLFDAALTDVRMPDMSGIDLLRAVKAHDDSIEVVIMTGYPTISSAVEALKDGAFDYLSKPLILDELRHLMSRLMERRFLRGEVHSLRARLGEELTVNELIGASAPMQQVKDIIGKVAVTDSPVLIEGESGTGKELVAAAIHRLSDRAKMPFIPVNCSAIPADLLESEFFGHVRGAFSGAVADALGLFRGANQGTIFLDEIARNRGAIDPHERTLASRASVMNRRRHQLLAGARLAADQHARVRRRHARDHLPERAYRRRVADHLPRQAEVRAQRACLTARPSQLERRRQRQQHTLGCERLFQEVECTQLGRLHGVTQAGLATHHHDRNVRQGVAQAGQRSDPIEIARHHQVQEHDVRLELERPGNSLRAFRRLADVVPLAAQQRADHPSDVRLVVDDQDGWHVARSDLGAPHRVGDA